ncbi:MAG: hypothetical protein H0V82_04705 [Candidatus Protochlamydia sp.]|nr:hypothetical protein [Candidatus Protochlamydia sp.]
MSKNWLKYSNEVKKEWVCQQGISLRKVSRCQTANEAVEFIIKNKLTAANLSEYPDLTDSDLEKLVKDCPQLNFLIIKSNEITGDKLADALKAFTKLQHLNLLCCQQIFEGLLVDALKELPQLQHLDLSHCQQITGDKLADALQFPFQNVNPCAA